MGIATNEETGVRIGTLSHCAVDGRRLEPLRIVENFEVGEFADKSFHDLCCAIRTATVHHNERHAVQPDITGHERADASLDMPRLIQSRYHRQYV